MGTESKDVPLPVDKEWLAGVVNEKCPGSKGVLKDTKCGIIAEGKGFVSFINRVHLEWDEEHSQGLDGLPKSLILKLPTGSKLHEISEDMAKFVQEEMLCYAHNQECATYEMFNDESMIGARPIPTAKCYHLQERTDADEGLIILEDLTDEAVSFGFGDTMGKEHLLVLAKHIGTLHAFGFNNPSYVDKLKVPDRAQMGEHFKDVTKITNPLFEMFTDLPFTQTELHKILEQINEHIDFFKDPTDQGLTTVLGMGDTQPNNILWRRDVTDPSKPSTEVKAFIDFQGTAPNFVAHDLQNSITLSVSAADRRAFEDDAIRAYWDTFQERLTAEGKDRAEGYNLAEFMTLYRKTMFATLVFLLPMMRNIWEATGKKEEIEAEFKKKLIWAYEDLDKKYTHL